MNLSMPATRVGPAAAQALQVTLVVISAMLPLFVPLWAIFSFVLVPTAARGLRNTDSTPGPRWLKWPLALVSLPLKLAAGLAWLLYAYVTVPIQPFVLLVYELLRLCTCPTWGAGRAGLVQVAPADGGPTIEVKVQGRPTVSTSHDAPDQGIDHNARLYSVKERGGPPEQGPTAMPRVGLKGLRRGLGASGALTDSLETIQERRNRYTRVSTRSGPRSRAGRPSTTKTPRRCGLATCASSAPIGWRNARRRASRCLGGRSCPRRPFSASHSSRQFKRRLGRAFIGRSFGMRLGA